MNSSSIEMLLQRRGAWLKGMKSDQAGAKQRESLSRMIADDYIRFENLRDLMFNLAAANTREEHDVIFENPGLVRLIDQMERVGLIHKGPLGGVGLDTKARRYLSGGWLEELVWLAAVDAGAHEALFGQVVGWQVKDYSGENEIDLIMRHGDKLAFVSCKALRSRLDIQDKKHRNRLMDAVHEADNLSDHFGQQGEKVAVVLTTDLFDELKNMPRYQALMGKAAVLDVRVIALEELVWIKLVDAFRELLR